MDGYGLYFQDGIHEWLLSLATTVVIADPKYVALSQTDFNNDGLGFVEIENPGVLNYNRASIVDADTWYAAVTHPTAGVTQSANKVDIEFGPSTGPWGGVPPTQNPVFGFCVVSHPTDPIIPGSPQANMYFGGNLDVAKIIETDTKAIFAADNLKLQTKNTVV